MRTLFIALFAVLVTTATFAQLTYEHTFLTMLSPSQIVTFTDYGEKITIIDKDSPIVRIYNPDYTIFKTIHCPNIWGYKLAGFYAMSDKLMNNDNLIELGLTYYDSANNAYTSRVINENGVNIAMFDGMAYGVVHRLNGAYKLYMYRIYTPDNYVGTDIYGLPGTIPCGDCQNLSTKNINSNNTGIQYEASPNPASNSITINYTIPISAVGALISLYNEAGNKMGSYEISSGKSSLQINTADLQSGVYFYQMTGAGIYEKAKKVLIIK